MWVSTHIYFSKSNVYLYYLRCSDIFCSVPFFVMLVLIDRSCQYPSLGLYSLCAGTSWTSEHMERYGSSATWCKPVGSSLVLDTARWGGRGVRMSFLWFRALGPLHWWGGLRNAATSFVVSSLYLQVCPRNERGSRNSEGRLISSMQELTVYLWACCPVSHSPYL